MSPVIQNWERNHLIATMWGRRRAKSISYFLSSSCCYIFDETAKTKEHSSGDLFASSIFLSILNIPRQWLIGSGYELVQFLPVFCSHVYMSVAGSEEDDDLSIYRYTSSTTILFETGMCGIKILVRRKRRLVVIQKAPKVVMRLMDGCKMKEDCCENKASYWIERPVVVGIVQL